MVWESFPVAVTMVNTSFPRAVVPVAELVHCRNVSHGNHTRMAADKDADAEDTDFGAVLYIIVVLTFYSFGIVIMIVKYLRTEKKEMEEEMVLESFFKGIPDNRLQNEREAVNRVAIQAFHTLTAARAANMDDLSTKSIPARNEEQHCDKKRSSNVVTHASGLTVHPGTSMAMSELASFDQNNSRLNPVQYRRERYSIQPRNIATFPQRFHEENEVEKHHHGFHQQNRPDVGMACQPEICIEMRPLRPKDFTAKSLDSCDVTFSPCATIVSSKEYTNSPRSSKRMPGKKETKPNKSVLFSFDDTQRTRDGESNASQTPKTRSESIYNNTRDENAHQIFQKRCIPSSSFQDSDKNYASNSADGVKCFSQIHDIENFSDVEPSGCRSKYPDAERKSTDQPFCFHDISKPEMSSNYSGIYCETESCKDRLSNLLTNLHDSMSGRLATMPNTQLSSDLHSIDTLSTSSSPKILSHSECHGIDNSPSDTIYPYGEKSEDGNPDGSENPNSSGLSMQHCHRHINTLSSLAAEIILRLNETETTGSNESIKKLCLVTDL